MSEDLKPCPFCGSTDLHMQDVDRFLQCYNCDATGPWHIDQTEAEAVAAWNRRADPIARLEAWREEKPDLRTFEVYSRTMQADGNWLVILRTVPERTGHYGLTLAEAVEVAMKGGDDAGE